VIAKAFPGATSLTYAVPDFHELAGWNSDFQLAVGVPVDWTVEATKTTNVDWSPPCRPVCRTIMTAASSRSPPSTVSYPRPDPAG
jgi:hypothetical protein